jgi:MFS family permease
MKFPIAIPLGRDTWQQTFAALNHHNYRLWFLGQLVSLVGSWMQTTAQQYLIYELTESSAYLGLIGFVGGVPTWLFMLYGGIVADRFSRRSMLIVTQVTMMVLAFVLAGLVFLGSVQPWHLLVMAGLLGIATAFDAPARQAFVVELVDRHDLTNAIALNSSMFNMAVVIGPAVAGFTYAKVGPAWCFMINAFSFIAVIIALILMKLKPAGPSTRRASALLDLREGLSYTVSNSQIRFLIINMGVLSLFGLSVMNLLPAWAVSVLGGDVQTNGLLLSARGLGALAGALMIAALSYRGVRGKIWTIGNLLLPLAMISFSFTRWLPFSLVFMVVIGWGFMTQANTSNALVQTQVPDHLRGRVMSIYTLIFFGTMPVGSLIAGTLASRISEPLTVLISGLILACVAAFVWIRVPSLRKQQ